MRCLAASSLFPYREPAARMAVTTPPRLSSVTFRKPGPATSTLAMPATCREPGGDDLGDLPRRAAGLLGEHQRDVARVIAVVSVARPLDVHRLRHRRLELAGGDRLGHDRTDRDGEFGRSHVPRVSTQATSTIELPPGRAARPTVRRMPGEPADHLDQIVRVERLRQVGVDPEPGAAPDVRLLRPGRQQHDLHVAPSPGRCAAARPHPSRPGWASSRPA